MATIALDVETNARDPRCDPTFSVLGVSYASDSGLSGYLAMGHRGTSHEQMAVSLSELRRLVVGASRFVFHNAKFDLVCLERLGFPLWDKEWYDTMLMAHFIDENLPNKGLDYLGKHYFDEGKEVSEEFSNFLKVFGWEFMPQWMIEPYAIQDAKLTLRLFFHLLKEFTSQGFCKPIERVDT